MAELTSPLPSTKNAVTADKHYPLYNEAPRDAAPSMTPWDQTCLKSLYATEQIAKTQRGEIARAMVREIAH